MTSAIIICIHIEEYALDIKIQKNRVIQQSNQKHIKH